MPVPPDTEALYRSMRTPELTLFKSALALDQRAGAPSDFCQPRIDLITGILAERPVCSDCDGRGSVLDAAAQNVLDGRTYRDTCPTCHGTGVV